MQKNFQCVCFLTQYQLGQFHSSNICFTGVPGGEEKETGAQNVSEEIMAGNFSNFGKRH